jgi:glucoamylase
MPAPFLGTAVVGSGGLTVAIDAYGNIVDMRAPGPSGAAAIDNPADRQAAGSVSARTGIVPRLRVGDGPALPMWRAESVRQRYLAGTNVLRTTATFAGPGLPGRVEVEIVDATRGDRLARLIRVEGPTRAPLALRQSIHLVAGSQVRCRQERRRRGLALICAPRGAGGGRSPSAERPSEEALAPAARPPSPFLGAKRAMSANAAADRRWLDRARPLGAGAPRWARAMYRRSLLVLRALTDRRTGAVAAGARDGWAYVWPRDAATAALAFAASGYRSEARRVASFLTGLDLGAAARFRGDGVPVPGRQAQGDARGWVRSAARAAGLSPTIPPRPSEDRAGSWRGRSDYQEGAAGDYLANAIAKWAEGDKARSAEQPRGVDIKREFGIGNGLVRGAGEPDSGLDSAAAWAVRPFAQPALFPSARLTLLRLVDQAGRFGITPGEGWPGADPWTAPTAWSAWSLAALDERSEALRLLTALRRASTPAGDLPERVDARTGIPRSTTPLAWSHAFAILALRQFWPL